MPERAISLASALRFRSLLAATLAPVVLYGLHASAAAECLENPDLRVADPGHWFYHFDRTLNRRCWHFAPTEEAATANPSAPVAAPAPAAAAEDNRPSFFSRFATGLSETFSPPQAPPQAQPQPQPNAAQDSSGEAAQAVAPKPPRRNKTAVQERPHEERPHEARPPTTTGAAAAEHHDQPPPSAAASDDKHDSPLNVADREALFQDFMKWQMERSMFGRP
jgi:hypothetical protein